MLGLGQTAGDIFRSALCVQCQLSGANTKTGNAGGLLSTEYCGGWGWLPTTTSIKVIFSNLSSSHSRGPIKNVYFQIVSALCTDCLSTQYTCIYTKHISVYVSLYNLMFVVYILHTLNGRQAGKYRQIKRILIPMYIHTYLVEHTYNNISTYVCLYYIVECLLSLSLTPSLFISLSSFLFAFKVKSRRDHQSFRSFFELLPF